MQSPMDDFDADGAQQLDEGNESNTALLQLQDAFVSALTTSGALGKIRAELRATALSLLRGDEELQRAAVGDVLRPASLSASAKVGLLLLYEFLQYHHLRQTAGVLEVEGSVHLFSGEQDALLGSLKNLPGKGPLLERLVQLYDPNRNAASAVSAAAETTTVSSGAVALADLSPDVGAAPMGVAPTVSAALSLQPTEPFVLPENEDVLREYEAMEQSVAFSDVDGGVEEVMRECDEVDNV